MLHKEVQLCRLAPACLLLQLLACLRVVVATPEELQLVAEGGADLLKGPLSPENEEQVGSCIGDRQLPWLSYVTMGPCPCACCSELPWWRGWGPTHLLFLLFCRPSRH